MPFALKNEIKLSGNCDKSQTEKHGWNDRSSELSLKEWMSSIKNRTLLKKTF